MQKQSLATSHQQTNVQLVSQERLTLKNSRPPLMLNMMLYGMMYLFAQFGSALLAMSPLNLLCAPRQLAHCWW